MARGSYIIWFISLLFLLLLWPPLLWHWVAKSCPTLWTNGLQHARLLCPPLSSGVCSNLCLLSQWCNLTISSSAFFLLLSIFPSIRVFSNESVLHIRWPKYWSFSFSISPSNEYLGLISFRIDWFDLLAVQGILKTLIQNHNLKASILGHSDFFMIQLSQLYMTIGKTICCSVTQLYPTFSNPMDCSMPDFLALHYLLELAQIHVHWVRDTWYHQTISSSVAPFSSCIQSFASSGFFPINHFFTSGGQRTGALASVSVLSKNI